MCLPLSLLCVCVCACSEYVKVYCKGVEQEFLGGGGGEGGWGGAGGSVTPPADKSKSSGSTVPKKYSERCVCRVKGGEGNA